ncbi:MAG: HAMP domain-containing sensor histidine kinase [Gammaproteobacteria bacterium]|nr:HAMP domain-containing sensor histidine kinase [Gammaproteobacteria bacterium]
MSIRKLLFETAAILFVITLSVIAFNSFQIRHNAERNLIKLQEEYFDTTYQIYKDEIVGNLLLSDPVIEKALFNEIAKRRGIALSLTYQEHHIESGISTTETPVKIYEINLGEGKTASLALYPIKDIKRPWVINELITPLILEALILSLGFVFLWRRFNRSLLAPLSELASALKSGEIETYRSHVTTIHEIINLSDMLKFMNIEIQKKALIEAEVNAAKQVGHDIRSPLACLVLSLSQMSSLPEKQRTLMRSAIQRITDITNCLHIKAQKISDTKINNHKIESLMISSIVDSLISEMRMQVREKKNIKIDFNTEKSYGLFSKINPVELKRVISNLINNGIESFDKEDHQIKVSVERIEKWVQIEIKDNGKGIPPEILNKIGKQGFSYGKESNQNSGSGLGISHAIKTIQSFGGTFSIHSELQKGTSAIIKLPLSNEPSWFIKKINLMKVCQVVILDDDQSIYNLWFDRFNRLPKRKIDLIHLTNGNQFQDYFFKNYQSNKNNLLFLFDFELLNQNITGLDLVEKFNIAKHSILVTSHYEDLKIINRCQKIGLKIIPKSIAAFIPIAI